MCLDSITKTQEPDDTEFGGWKIFAFDGFPSALVYDYSFALDEWNKVPANVKIHCPYFTFIYPAGFHVLSSLEACREWAVAHRWTGYTVCQVKLRKVHTVGEQDNLITHVGEEIFISSEDWEKRERIQDYEFTSKTE